MDMKRRVNLYGWTEEHDRDIEVVYKKLAAKGVRGIERDGKPNTSAILLYLLEMAAKEKSK